MKRLTKYGKTSHKNGVCCTHFNSAECRELEGNCAYDCKWEEEEVWSKLAYYEDLEEQGYKMINMDNVVEQLEYIKMRHFLTMANTGDDNLDFAYEYVGNALDTAIEIVKGGAK